MSASATRAGRRASDDPPAVLLGGDVTAVPVARSLGRRGVKVYALGGAHAPVRHSRYCSEYANLGSGSDAQRRWLDWLQRGPAGAAILPCSDDGLELIARNRRTLVDLGYAPMEGDDSVSLAMLDKARTYELASEVGIPAPRALAIRNEEDVDTAVAQFTYPCGVKPLHAHHARHRGLPAKLLLAHDPQQLRVALGQMRTLGLQVMVTELIPGADDSLVSYNSYIDEQGNPLLHLTTRKLRQCPIHFGIASYLLTEWDREVAELGLRFLQGIGLRGMAQVEFKRSAADGRPMLIECNHRFVTYTELFRHAGIDLPLLAYDRSLGRPTPSDHSLKYGVRIWFPREDIRALRSYRRSGELSLARWALSLLHRLHLPVFSLSDPWPTIASALGALWRTARRLVREAARVDPHRGSPTA